MKILIVTAMFPPIRTGTSFHSTNLADALTKNGHAVTVVTVSNIESGVDDYSFPVKRIPSLHFPLKNYFKHLRLTAFFPGNYYRVLKAAKSSKADVILLINHYLDIAFPAIFASKLTGLPLVVSVGTQLHSANPIRDKILYILDRVICGKMVFPFCDKIISWDTEIERYLKSVHGPRILEKSTVVPYGVNGDTKSFLCHTHDYSRVEQILGVGSVVEQRDFVLLVKVFKELLGDYPGLRLKIIGHVYYDAAVRLAKEMGIGDKVDFTGELSHDKVLEELKKSTIFSTMLSRNYAGLGTATIEAMLMGVPIISNVPEDLFGKRLLKDMENYICVDASSVERSTAKIKKFLSDEELRKTVGTGGRRFVEEHMDWSSVALKMEEVLSETIGKRK